MPAGSADLDHQTAILDRADAVRTRASLALSFGHLIRPISAERPRRGEC
jgi:hypothetical protein